MLGIYLLAGRSIRQKTGLVGYVFPTYAMAALILAFLVWLMDLPASGFSSRTYLFLILLGLVPQCLGHTSYNWALERLSATTVSVLALAEPLVATALAWSILGERPGWALVGGGGLIALGILLVAGGGVKLPETECRYRSRESSP
jgi:drug/metabolite transporter (DMT)-like permease